MKLAIVGSRSFVDYNFLENSLSLLIISTISEIVSGGAKGTDKLAEQFANTFHIPLTVFKPDWERYGKGAGFRRNIQIVDYSDMIVAFWDNRSPGTKHTITYAEKQGKDLIVYSIH